MKTYFPVRWHVGLVMLILTTVFGVQLALPDSAFADNYSWRGRKITMDNYGTSARIGTTTPLVFGNHASFEFILSGSSVGVNRFVQTGWTRQSSCGSQTTVFWEYYNPDLANDYVNGCGPQDPGGENDYYNEYNPATGALYWCHGYNGQVLNCEYATQTGFQKATYIAAYGETSHWSSSQPVEMGETGIGAAVYIQNIWYKKAQPNPGSWAAVQYAGVNYAGCGASPCPYTYGYGFAASVLYTYNWTN